MRISVTWTLRVFFYIKIIIQRYKKNIEIREKSMIGLVLL